MTENRPGTLWAGTLSFMGDECTGPDLSELDGLEYTCLDGCGLCCLCQPELLPNEESNFRADAALSAGLAERHISPDVRGAAIRLQGAHGACHFLRGRRCSIYERRPHYCRAFPISVFAGWRIQLNANLSCRGIGLPGEDLMAFGREVLGHFREDDLRRELSGSRRVFDEFTTNTRDAKVAQSVPSLRDAAEALMGELTNPIGLSRVLTYSESGRTRQNSSAADIARRARASEPEADLQELGTLIGTDLFDLPDLSYLPVYVDEGLGWSVFKLVGGEIVGYELLEDGDTEEVSMTAPSEVNIMPMTAAGRETFESYLRTVNRRDCFVGHAAHLLDEDGYSYNFAQAYVGALGHAAVDLWWRASFLALLRGEGSLDRRAVREGIIFFDMDALDQPTIGAFL
jgi:Fe-S-cluster containining protein